MRETGSSKVNSGVCLVIYIIEGEQVRRQVLGEVLLNAGLLSPQKMRHSGGYGTQGIGLERRRKMKRKMRSRLRGSI